LIIRSFFKTWLVLVDFWRVLFVVQACFLAFFSCFFVVVDADGYALLVYVRKL